MPSGDERCGAVNHLCLPHSGRSSAQPATIARTRYTQAVLARLASVSFVAVLWATLSCSDTGRFACDFDSQCTRADLAEAGTCEPTGVCSFPDFGCEASGRRYGEHAGDLSGECVVAEATGTLGSTGDDDGDSTAAMTTTGVGATSTTAASTSGTSGESTTGGESSDSSSGTAEAEYGPCIRGGCAEMSEACVTADAGSFCAPPCGVGMTCPAPPEGDGSTACVRNEVMGDLRCVLVCANQGDCPMGMLCDFIDGMTGICVWTS